MRGVEDKTEISEGMVGGIDQLVGGIGDGGTAVIEQAVGG